MLNLYHVASGDCSRMITNRYSTSFASAIRLLHKDMRQPIHNIYGFVRLADEIVDTFHSFDKHTLLQQFKEETYQAIERGISTNPILHSFQQTVNQYHIEKDLIEAFFHSMEMDLSRSMYNSEKYQDYIYGSAEVVGLMCLRVFCEKDSRLFNKLKTPARALGAAFQKVNFLRDFKMDYNDLSRIYFPGCDFHSFSRKEKAQIEADIQSDFDAAYNGILNLPLKSRLGVYVAYKYYYSLFEKIKKMQPSVIKKKRVRIPGFHKAMIVLTAGVKNQLRLI